MSVVQVLLLIVFVGMMSGGQILFKLASSTLAARSSFFQIIVEMTLNPYLICGILLYGFATILWIFILQTTPLSKAYPFVSLSLIIVPAIGIIFFNEAFSLPLVFGGLLIISGLLVITAWP
jgi:drug/metabolite transporter (DMT)-like permease